jgi:hypothetical protein
MKNQTIEMTRAVAGAAALFVLGACGSDVTSANRHPVQLSFTTNATIAAAGNRMAADLVVGPNSDLVLHRVQLVFGKIELDRTGDAECVAEVEDANDDHAHIGEECEDVSRDPIMVDVPVDAALHPAINVPLQAGTYSELEAKLEPPRDGSASFNAANPTLVGRSVRVEGTYKGNPFVFTSAVRSNLEMQFDPPLVIDETTKNATVSLDVRKWFLDNNGAVIDPTGVTAGSAARLLIENNIRRSFHAFEDDNERGEDHHEGHNGNGDGSHH